MSELRVAGAISSLAGGAKPSPGDVAYAKIKMRLLPLLTICYILAYIDRQNVGFAKLEFMKELGFSSAVYGLGGGLFYLGYSLFEVPSNLMLQKIGARKTLLRIMLGWGICACLFAFMTSATHFYALRFLLGVAEAGFFPGILLYISYWVPSSRRAAFTALFMAAMPISGVIGSPLSGVIMDRMSGLSGLSGWQWMFLIEGIPSILMAFVAYLLLPDRPSNARWLTDVEKAAITNELAHDSPASKNVSHAKLGAALRDRRFYGLAAMSATLLACIAGLQLWMPTIIRAAGVSSLLHVGLLAAIPPILSIAAQQYNARHSDRVAERRWHTALPVLCAAAGFAILPFVEGHLLSSMLSLLVVSAGLLAATGPFWALPSAYLSGTAAAGGIALITTIGGLAAFGSSSLAGGLNQLLGSENAGLFYYAALAALGPFLLLVLTRAPARKVG